jgi:hypothetical protein
MSPDAKALMAASASDALLNNQTLQTRNVRDESAAVPAQATTIAACFKTLIASHLHMRKPGANPTSAISPIG